MSGTYKATGINLKSAPLGESDRLLTVLTEEVGLIRVVAPGARKHKSSLGGRSGLLVVNQLVIAKGRNLDKIIQADGLESYPGLSQDLGKLTASQYLAELVLYQALTDHPQVELFCLLREHLSRLERSPASSTLACLVQATFHLLAWAGLAPQVQSCCVTQQVVTPQFTDPGWRIGFSITAGGIVYPSELDPGPTRPTRHPLTVQGAATASSQPKSLSNIYLNATELYALQQLAQPELHPVGSVPSGTQVEYWDRLDPLPWRSLERVLRHYAEYHLDHVIRSATLIDACFPAETAPSLAHKS